MCLGGGGEKSIAVPDIEHRLKISLQQSPMRELLFSLEYYSTTLQAFTLRKCFMLSSLKVLFLSVISLFLGSVLGSAICFLNVYLLVPNSCMFES